MPVTQSELGTQFYTGEQRGTASNVRIESFPALELTALIGYGHAVYAIRETDTGHITSFPAWKSYSMTTSCQFTALALNSENGRVDSTVDRQLKLKHLRAGERDELPDEMRNLYDEQ